MSRFAVHHQPRLRIVVRPRFRWKDDDVPGVYNTISSALTTLRLADTLPVRSAVWRLAKISVTLLQKNHFHDKAPYLLNKARISLPRSAWERSVRRSAPRDAERPQAFPRRAWERDPTLLQKNRFHDKAPKKNKNSVPINMMMKCRCGFQPHDPSANVSCAAKNRTYGSSPSS